jgi:hypothetical protein
MPSTPCSSKSAHAADGRPAPLGCGPFLCRISCYGHDRRRDPDATLVVWREPARHDAPQIWLLNAPPPWHLPAQSYSRAAGRLCRPRSGSEARPSGRGAKVTAIRETIETAIAPAFGSPIDSDLGRILQQALTGTESPTCSLATSWFSTSTTLSRAGCRHSSTRGDRHLILSGPRAAEIGSPARSPAMRGGGMGQCRHAARTHRARRSQRHFRPSAT